MSRINLERIDRSIVTWNRRWGKRDWAACDLARPALELRALASLMGSLPWIDEAVEVDAQLLVGLAHGEPWMLQERSMHAALAIARDVLARGLAALPEATASDAPRAVEWKETYSATPHTYTRSSGSWAMPDGHYGPGMVVVDEEAGPTGYLLVSRGHGDGGVRPLAATLLAIVLPGSGVGRVVEGGYGEFAIERPTDGIERVGAGCAAVAAAMLTEMRSRVRDLPMEGMPSAFTDEDDDARDVLAAMLASGSRVHRVRSGDDADDDLDGPFRYLLDDGTEVPFVIAERLVRAEILLPEDGLWGRSSVLVAGPNLTGRALRPRDRAVSFDAFQDRCIYRRHPEDHGRECVNRNNRGCEPYCEADSCPILVRVHETEYAERYRLRGREDPAFEDHLLSERRDPLMEALHVNTRRSLAWRAAGEGRMMGAVNQVLQAHLAYGIPMLLETRHAVAIAEAVEAGWLEVVERNAIGVVSKPTTALLAAYERMRRDAQAAAA